MATRASSTEEVLEKITTGSLSDGGLLKPHEFDSFFEDVQGRTDVLDRTRAVSVEAPEGEIPRLDIAPKTMTAVAEGEEAPLSSVEQPSVPFHCQKVSIATQLTHEAAAETIDDFESAVRNMLAQGFAQDLERVASVGDTSATGFQAINDGWITLAENKGSPTYDHTDSGGTAQPVNKELFAGMIEKLPEKYREASPEPVFLMSKDNKFQYQQALTDRNTGAGDAMLMTNQEPRGYGHDILTPLSWPSDTVMLTSPRNLVYLVQERMRVKDSKEGKEITLKDLAVVINFLGKIDYQIMEPNGVVLGTGIATS
jgi:hypothetical protein